MLVPAQGEQEITSASAPLPRPAVRGFAKTRAAMRWSTKLAPSPSQLKGKRAARALRRRPVRDPQTGHQQLLPRRASAHKSTTGSQNSRITFNLL